MKKGLFILIAFFLSLTINAQDIVRYVTANLNMRSEPNTKSCIITTIPKGTSVTIEDNCKCTWIPIRYKGYIGYVSTKYLSKHKISSNTARPVGKIRYYKNSRNERVQSPTKYTSVPAGATALCRDGTYSFSRSRRGTCSHHGGVQKWLE